MCHQSAGNNLETIDFILLYANNINQYSALAVGFTGGLILGSFINVIVYRIPLMIENTLQLNTIHILEQMGIQTNTHKVVNQSSGFREFNITKPRSHCPTCAQQLLNRHLIPLLSFVLLLGKCHFCKRPISIRYPLIEIISGTMTAYIFYRFGFTLMTAGSCAFLWILLALSFIDLEKKILPDSLTIPLLWLGLAFNLITDNVAIETSILGVIAGYIFLQAIALIFRWTTTREGIGQGDIKLTASLGAWLGWASLPTLLVLSSSLGIIVQCARMLVNNSKDREFAFGPYLAIGGLIVFFWEIEINHLLSQYIN